MVTGDFIVDLDFDCNQSKNKEDSVHVFFAKSFDDDRGTFRVDWTGGSDGLFDSNDRFVGMSWVKQWNTSYSRKNVFRGMHAQSGKCCQGKLVTCKNGSIIDVIVDARPDSKTFMTAKSYLLDSRRGMRLWVPRGFLHGFLSLTDNAVFEYFCDNLYEKESEVGVSILSVLENPKIKMLDFYQPGYSFRSEFTTRLNSGEVLISEKDRSLTDFESFRKNTTENWYK